MSSQLPEPDQALVAFLRAHRPQPPAPPPDHEARLIGAIARLPQRRGVLPLLGIILLVVAGSLSFGRPQTQMALTEKERLEIFTQLLAEWQYLEPEPSSEVFYTGESDGQIE
ncbi:MAG: hypothetical protein ACK4QL_03205 [Pseudanabaenaceae cyanobacterium]